MMKYNIINITIIKYNNFVEKILESVLKTSSHNSQNVIKELSFHEYKKRKIIEPDRIFI